uniref:Uncharacterized protein n=1 Tax=Arundo donax TaxID=35708 RepID=A0A0A9GXV3_ARUDO
MELGRDKQKSLIVQEGLLLCLRVCFGAHKSAQLLTLL